MDQQFQLKEYGKLSLFEQANMTAEERSWYMERLEKKMKDEEEQSRKK